MILDNAPGSVRADVCVIGAGPAGLTISKELSQSFRVILLEAGSDVLDVAPIEYQGHTIHTHAQLGDLKRDSKYLEVSRLRGIGGTSNHWSNYCRPLDRIDFEPRDYVAHSGWPIAYDELARYYPRAFRYCGLPDDSDRPYGGQQTLSANWLETQFYRWRKDPVRFGALVQTELRSSDRLLLIPRAIAYDLAVDNGVVRAVTFRTRDGRTHQVKAGQYVLATGGIENARLLLHLRRTSCPQFPAALGQFFMEHPHFYVGTLAAEAAIESVLRTYDVFQNTSPGVLCIPPERQRQLKVLNHHIDIDPEAHIPEFLSTGPDVRFLDQFAGRAHRMYGLRCILEMTPKARSRVELTDETDSLGIPRPVLTIEYSDQEFYTVEMCLRLLSRQFARFGRVRAVFEPVEFGKHFAYYGFHHIGTTRMAKSESDGCVDTNCRLFGTRNLYLAGSSVFPTAGHAPPTLSIIAMALRLAEHLKSFLK